MPLKRVIAPLAALLSAVVLLLMVEHLVDNVATDSGTHRVQPLVVVDAGHGDFDGGAVAKDGTEEKDINLAIAQKLAVLLPLCGYRVQMTRVDDTALHDSSASSIREKKVSDTKARLALFEQADINISIHQNMFGAAAYHGTQVFYSANHPDSKAFAEAIREEVVRLVQPDNTRACKAGNRDIYLLYHASRPTVLVECGFLSNVAELERLKSEDYQWQLAFAVAGGVMRRHSSEEGGAN